MALSPNLLEVEHALNEANQTLLDTYGEFRDRNHLYEGLVNSLLTNPSRHRRVSLDLGGYFADYRVFYAGEANNDLLAGIGIIFAQQEGVTYQPGDPESVGILLDPRDYSKPLQFSYGWKPAEADITNIKIAAYDSRVLRLTQETRRDLIFKGPDSLTEDFTPIQSINIDFSWTDRLVGWRTTFTLVGDEYEDDVHYPLNHMGDGFPSGFKIEECLLPEWIDMTLAIENILTQKPALLGAAAFFQPRKST